jgi:RNA polymerase sigma-70 factor (ECF subfamily)
MENLASRQTPPSLLLRVRDPGDAESWQTFVGVYAPLIYRYCRRCKLQDADAADVTQEVLAQVARSIRTFEYQPERGRFRDWLGAVTRSKVVRFHARRGKEEAAGEEQLEGVGPAADAEWAEQFNARVLQAALERVRPHFEPSTWEAFEQSWLHDQPAPAVAQALGLEVVKVYWARSRVLKRLREEVRVLAEELPDLPAG